MWNVLLYIIVAGAVGGLVNALMSDNGFIMPRAEKIGDVRVLRPGVFVNIIIGIVAACISWGLYGPMAAYNIIGVPSAQSDPSLTLSALVGALLVGVGGSRWLTNEVDKSLLQGAAAKLASSPSDKDKAVEVALASPAQAAALAESM